MPCRAMLCETLCLNPCFIDAVATMTLITIHFCGQCSEWLWCGLCCNSLPTGVMLSTVLCVVPVSGGWAWAKSAMASEGLVNPSDVGGFTGLFTRCGCSGVRAAADVIDCHECWLVV
jgi:hypothetical protein